METSMQSSAQLHQMQSITISTREGLHFINPEDIIRLQADSNYTFFHFTNRKPLLVSKVLKEFIPLLEPQGFLRTHRAHLINRRYVSGVDRTGHVIMRDESKAEISRSKRRVVKMELMKAG